MKLLNGLMVLVAVMSGNASAKSYEVDHKASGLEWTGSKIVGDKHTGTIKIKSGEIVYKSNQPTEATIVVDMASIANADVADPKWNKKLVDHLKSDDFFGVAKHPEANIKINKFSPQKNGSYKLSGNLTIKGVTKPVNLTASVKRSNAKIDRVVADLEFDRTDFNVRYGSGKFFENLGDKMISDTVQVRVDLKLKQPIELGQN